MASWWCAVWCWSLVGRFVLVGILVGDLSIILLRKGNTRIISMDMNLHVGVRRRPWCGWARPSRKLGDSCAYGRIWIMSLLSGIVTEL